MTGYDDDDDVNVDDDDDGGSRREMDAGIESLGAPSVEQPRGLLNE